MAKCDTKSYLVVKLSDLVDEKYIGCKCIPACWVENSPSNNDLIIRYPEVENSETRLQVKNKNLPKPTWPLYSAFIMFRTAVVATPSTSYKRRNSEENTNNDIVPKKKRESAIRSENKLKMLVINGQVDAKKQKVSPKKVPSLQNKDRTEILATLVSASNSVILDDLYRKTVAADGLKDNVEMRDSLPETLPPLNLPKATNVPKREKASNISNSTNIFKDIRKSKSPSREPVDDSTIKILDDIKETESNSDVSRSSLHAKVLALHDLMQSLAPDNSENDTQCPKTVDINHINDIYKTVLEVKSQFNAVYIQKSIKLRKSFETIQLFVPELKRGLTLPTLEEIKKKRQAVGVQLKPLSSLEEELSEVRDPSSPHEVKTFQLKEP